MKCPAFGSERQTPEPKKGGPRRGMSQHGDDVENGYGGRGKVALLSVRKQVLEKGGPRTGQGERGILLERRNMLL